MSDGAIEKKPGAIAQFFRSIRGDNASADIKQSVREALADPNEEEAASLSETEREILANLMKYGEVRVEDILVPRADIVAVEVNTPLSDFLKVASEAAHSRLPVYRESLDDLLGIVHVKDVLSFLANENPPEKFDLNKLRRGVIFAPPSMRIIDLLTKMRRQRIHMAVVVDEYGGTDGLVTIEDVVEQIVGDIEDEHDVDAGPMLRKMSNGGLMADARLEVEALEDELGVSLLDEEEEDDVDTLGGLVFMMAGEVPEIGTCLEHDTGVVFEVIDADLRRIKRIRIHEVGMYNVGRQVVPSESELDLSPQPEEVTSTNTASQPQAVSQPNAVAYKAGEA